MIQTLLGLFAFTGFLLHGLGSATPPARAVAGSHYLTGSFGDCTRQGTVTIEFRIDNPNAGGGPSSRTIKVSIPIPAGTTGTQKAEHLAVALNAVDAQHPNDPAESPGNFVTAGNVGNTFSIVSDLGGVGVKRTPKPELSATAKESETLSRVGQAASDSAHPQSPPNATDAASAAPMIHVGFFALEGLAVGDAPPLAGGGPGFVRLSIGEQEVQVSTHSGQTGPEIIEALAEAFAAHGLDAGVVFDGLLYVAMSGSNLSVPGMGCYVCDDSDLRHRMWVP